MKKKIMFTWSNNFKPGEVGHSGPEAISDSHPSLAPVGRLVGAGLNLRTVDVSRGCAAQAVHLDQEMVEDVWVDVGAGRVHCAPAAVSLNAATAL